MASTRKEDVEDDFDRDALMNTNDMFNQNLAQSMESNKLEPDTDEKRKQPQKVEKQEDSVNI